jgi:DNA-binding NtrC family response regulator
MAKAKYRFLVVDDEIWILDLIRKLLKDEPQIEVQGCGTAQEAIDLIRASPYRYAVILMDFKLPQMSGADATRAILEINPHQTIAMFSGDLSQEAALESWRAGAADFIEKGSTGIKEKILLSLQKYIESHEIFEDDPTPSENRSIIEQINIAGASPEMAQVATLVQRAAVSDASVLITGESGVGKELIAKAIHDLSLRAKRKYIKENMTAVPNELFESTFFGHTKGSFTGAFENKTGHFKEANGGTIFLDEIGDLCLSHQAKLLRVLESGEFYPVGSNKVEQVNVRVVAATNKNLEASVVDKTFRTDLFYRLNIIRIHIPPLRDRIEDVRPLVESFRKKRKSQQVILSEVIQKFEKYSWPGNIRELYSELTRLHEVFKNEPRITLKHLAPKFFSETSSSQKQKSLMTFEEICNQHKRELVSLIKAHQRRHSNLRDVASEGLKIPYSTLFSKMKALGLVEIKDDAQEKLKNIDQEIKKGDQSENEI